MTARSKRIRAHQPRVRVKGRRGGGIRLIGHDDELGSRGGSSDQRGRRHGVGVWRRKPEETHAAESHTLTPKRIGPAVRKFLMCSYDALRFNHHICFSCYHCVTTGAHRYSMTSRRLLSLNDDQGEMNCAIYIVRITSRSRRKRRWSST